MVRNLAWKKCKVQLNTWNKEVSLSSGRWPRLIQPATEMNNDRYTPLRGIEGPEVGAG